MSCGSRDVVEADHYSLGGRLREPKSGFEALQRSFSLSVEHLRRAEVSCALADRASALVDSIAVSGSTAGVHGAVRIHDKSQRWDRLKPSVEVCGGLFFGCSLERLLCFVAIFARHEYGALAIPKQSVRPPQPGWKGLWRELVLQLDTLDDRPWRCLGGAFGQRVRVVQGFDARREAELSYLQQLVNRRHTAFLVQDSDRCGLPEWLGWPA